MLKRRVRDLSKLYQLDIRSGTADLGFDDLSLDYSRNNCIRDPVKWGELVINSSCMFDLKVGRRCFTFDTRSSERYAVHL